MASALYYVSGALPLAYAYAALAHATRPHPLGGRVIVDISWSRLRDADRARARRAHHAAADCISRRLVAGALAGTVMTGTGEL